MTGLTVFYRGGLLWINPAAKVCCVRRRRAETTRAIEIDRRGRISVTLACAKDAATACGGRSPCLSSTRSSQDSVPVSSAALVGSPSCVLTAILASMWRHEVGPW